MVTSKPILCLQQGDHPVNTDVGRDPGDKARRFRGSVGGLKIWQNYCLSEAQVSQLAALGPPAEHQGDIQVSRPVQTPGTHYGIEYKLELLPAATAEKQFNIDTREAQLDAVINTDEEYFTWPWPLGWLPGATECFTVAVWAKVQHAADVREVVQTPHGAGAFPVLSHHGSGTGWQVSMSADLAEFMVTLHKYPGIHHRKASSQYPTPTGELAGDVWYHLAGTYEARLCDSTSMASSAPKPKLTSR
jgi:hypothetical protein